MAKSLYKRAKADVKTLGKHASKFGKAASKFGKAAMKTTTGKVVAGGAALGAGVGGYYAYRKHKG